MQKKNLNFPPLVRGAFTLIELLVVAAIIVILAAVSIPAIKSLTKNNGQAQAVNQIRAQLAAARATAISQHRKAGVVFFDETPAFSKPVNSNQTGMQIFVEDYDQSVTKYGAHTGTIYVTYSSERQYLPPGIVVAALGVDATTSFESIRTGDNTGVGQQARCVLFDPNGQLVIENNMASPLRSSNYNALLVGQYPTAYGDWQFTDPPSAGSNPPFIPGNATSESTIFIFSKTDYNQQNFQSLNTTAGQNARTLWLEQHSDCIVINPYTGNVIR